MAAPRRIVLAARVTKRTTFASSAPSWKQNRAALHTGAAHVPQWEAAKACLQARLDNFQSVGFLAR